MKTKQLIDDLKGVCAAYGLGNDGNEFKIITQVFLYKFLNDKFAQEIKIIDPTLAKAESWETALADLDSDDREMLLLQLNADTAHLLPEQFISHLFENQNAPEFAKLFDDTLRDIAAANNDIFSVKTEGGTRIILFDRVSEFITDVSKRDAFCRALVNKMVEFSFEHIFTEKFDFYATIFEYLIKDYNKDSGGKYAEYYTPHAVSKIMAEILVPKNQQGKIRNVSCYDPAAGSGTLLMNLAHAIGGDRCSIFSQDISQKSSSLLRLNLILNNLVHSIQNIVQGNTMLHPFHKEGTALKKFDYIVSNPPFKMDYSDIHSDLESKENKERFFAGIAKIPKKKKEGMEIFPLFLQHVINSLNTNGKAAFVVPTGFVSAQSSINKKIRQKLVDEKMLAGVISMPSNIFATTGTNVSILFIDKANNEDVVLIDASGLGKTIKDGKNQKTVLSAIEQRKIIKTFNDKEAVKGLSEVVRYDEIAEKNYSFSANQYSDVVIEYVDIDKDQFDAKLAAHSKNLKGLFSQSHSLESKIFEQISKMTYE